MADDKSWNHETIIAAQPNRYEVIEISYGIGIYGGRNVLRVKYSHPDPGSLSDRTHSTMQSGVESERRLRCPKGAPIHPKFSYAFRTERRCRI